MSKAARLAFAVFVLMSFPAFAAIFIVPQDRELVAKSRGIIVGVVIGSTSELRDDGDVETIYDVRIERAMKGTFPRDSVVRVASPGGNVEKRWTMVPGSAHFQKDDKVVLFLVQHEGRWVTTDMTLGKFRFITSTGGQSLLLRDGEDIVGFDKQMRTHVEKIRREAGFLEFIEETVGGRDAESNYFVEPGEVVSLPALEKSRTPVVHDTFTAQSYAAHFINGQYPSRWPESRMGPATPRPFFKNSAQNASGLGDGGVQMITDSLNAWTYDCPSYVNIPYGGTNSLLKDGDDNVNTIVWNDPGNHIAGSWGAGGGTVAVTFLNGDDFHTFEGVIDGWVSLSDTDVVVQNGVTGAESFMATMMTHEIGHSLALRHSNKHHDGTACQSGDECTSTAVMNNVATILWNYTLQPWDQNAIRALYPAACNTPPPPTDVNAFTTSGTFVTVHWAASPDATSYKILRRNSTAASYTEIASGVPASPYIDNSVVSATSYQYVVRATNAIGDSGNSDADFTTAISFTDGPLVVAGDTTVKRAHFTELAIAINALRTLGGLGAFTFTGEAPALGATIKASHIEDMRVALDQAYTSVGAGGLVFDPLGSSVVMAYHMNSLRTLCR